LHLSTDGAFVGVEKAHAENGSGLKDRAKRATKVTSFNAPQKAAREARPVGEFLGRHFLLKARFANELT
jgi:hypothetical protein